MWLGLVMYNSLGPSLQGSDSGGVEIPGGMLGLKMKGFSFTKRNRYLPMMTYIVRLSLVFTRRLQYAQPCFAGML